MQYRRPDGEVRAVTRTVGAFALDRFEVTYSRFRSFVETYDLLALGRDGDGAHPRVAGSGWRAEWNALPELAKSRFELEHELSLCGAWRTDETQRLPARCVNWYMAARFCAWDNARLPSEAEWTFAASGGDENRSYPWGDAAPDDQHARLTLEEPAHSEPLEVGQLPEGRSKFNQFDMAGNVTEWVMDWYHERVSDASCIESNAGSTRAGMTRDCVELQPTEQHVAKGGSYLNFPEDVTTFARQGGYAAHVTGELGFRCARDPR